MAELATFPVVVTKHLRGSNLRKDEFLLAFSSKVQSYGAEGRWQKYGWLVPLYPTQEADSEWEVGPEHEASKTKT